RYWRHSPMTWRYALSLHDALPMLIRDDRVLRPEQRPEHGAVGIEAGGEQDRGLGAEESRDRLLQLEVQILGAADETHRGDPEAALIQGSRRGPDQLGVVGQPQIVVGAEVQHLAALAADGAGGD